MAYKMTKRGSLDNEITYEFFCDNIEDMEAIEKTYRVLGTIAIVLEGESGGLEIYITNSTREWTQLNIGVSGSNSNNSEIDEETIMTLINEAIEDIDSLDVKVVSSLPTSNISTNTIYLISTGNNIYDQYMYINSAWAKIGNTNIDLSNYATKTELNAKANSSSLATVATSGSYNDLINKPTIPSTPDLSTYATKTYVDTAVSNVDLSDYLQKDDIADWAKSEQKPTYTAQEVSAAPSKDFNDFKDLCGKTITLNNIVNFTGTARKTFNQLTQGYMGTFSETLTEPINIIKDHIYYTSMYVSRDGFTERNYGYFAITLGGLQRTPTVYIYKDEPDGYVESITGGASSSNSSNMIHYEVGIHNDGIPAGMIEISDFGCFDLTEMFGDEVANYILSLEQQSRNSGIAWFKNLIIRLRLVGMINDIQMNETSILNDGIANIPIATNTQLGVVKGNGYGIRVNSTGDMYISAAGISNEVKPGISNYLPIVPSNQHASTFYGLAKAAGDTTQASSSNSVGTYTDDAKTAIQTMLDIPSKSYVDTKIPNAPTTDGTYTLQVTVTNNTPTYTWVSTGA